MTVNFIKFISYFLAGLWGVVLIICIIFFPTMIMVLSRLQIKIMKQYAAKRGYTVRNLRQKEIKKIVAFSGFWYSDLPVLIWKKDNYQGWLFNVVYNLHLTNSGTGKYGTACVLLNPNPDNKQYSVDYSKVWQFLFNLRNELGGKKINDINLINTFGNLDNFGLLVEPTIGSEEKFDKLIDATINAYKKIIVSIKT